jgi:hypothetical protein
MCLAFPLFVPFYIADFLNRLSNKVCTPLALPTVGGASECPFKSINYCQRIFVKAFLWLVAMGVCADVSTGVEPLQA